MYYTKENTIGKCMRPALRSFWKAWLLAALGLWAAVSSGRMIQFVMEGVQIDQIAEDAHALQPVIIGLGILVALYAVIVKFLVPYLSNRYYVTETHVESIYGFIKKESKRTRISKIQNEKPEVGYIGRLIGFGDLDFFTSGSGGSDISFSGIYKPHDLSEMVQQMIMESESADEVGGEGETQSAAGASKVAELKEEVEKERQMRKEIERRLAIVEHLCGTSSATQSPVTTGQDQGVLAAGDKAKEPASSEAFSQNEGQAQPISEPSASPKLFGSSEFGVSGESDGSEAEKPAWGATQDPAAVQGNKSAADTIQSNYSDDKGQQDASGDDQDQQSESGGAESVGVLTR